MTTPDFDLKYPIGTFAYSGPYSAAERAANIEAIAALPAQLEAVVAPLTDAQLAMPYRPGGWTVRQVVHHLPDSHTHAMIRTKWTLTEATPRIKAYHEALYAQQPDYAGPIALSLNLLASVHARWVYLLRQLTEADFARAFEHPETGQTVTLDEVTGSYSWHGRHHLAHITEVLKRQGGQ